MTTSTPKASAPTLKTPTTASPYASKEGFMHYPFKSISLEQEKIVKAAAINAFFPNESCAELYDRISHSDENELDFIDELELVDQYSHTDNYALAGLIYDEYYRLLTILNDCLALNTTTQ